MNCKGEIAIGEAIGDMKKMHTLHCISNLLPALHPNALIQTVGRLDRHCDILFRWLFTKWRLAIHSRAHSLLFANLPLGSH